jgi:phosphoesterase RecJ-like protein
LPPLLEIEELVRQSRRILVVTHVAPDGDAIGSTLGLGWMLGAQAKEVTLVCEDPVPAIYVWLPGSTDIVRQGSGTYDLIICLDCSDERRMGQAFGDRTAALPLVNIDHHITNTCFGTVNWVDPSSVATAQMILTLADALGWELSQAVAVCLLSGLVTDTRSFRTSNVDAAAIRAALRLMEAGASLAEVAWRTLEQRPLSSVRLWGQAIDGLHLEDGILWATVTRAMRQRWGLSENDYSGLANFLSGVREANVALVFTERDDETVDVGMRAVPGYDVAQVALSLGGGGHRQAAGCTLLGNLAEIQERVLVEVRRSVAEQQAEDSH